MSFWRRRTEERTLTLANFGPGYFSTVEPQSALANPNVFACVRALADAAASCPLLVYRRLADGERNRASGRTADLLQRPSEGTTPAAFVSTVMSHLVLWGNAFVGKYRDAEGRVEGLLPIRPDRVQVERRGGRIVFTITDEAGRQREHGSEDVIHVKALSTDGLIGLSPIRQMRSALELDDATRAASTALMRNGGRPSGVLKLGSGGNRDQVNALKESWQARHTGELAGGIAVMTGDLDFVPLSMPADDAQFVEARRLSATEIARAFRVPAWMISAGDASSQTYSNVESQMLSFVMYSLRPWLTVIEQALTADRDLFTPSLFAEFLIDGLLRADSKTRAEVYKLALDPLTGWMRRDEVRRLENLEPESVDEQIPQLTTTNGQGVLS